ncbi:MAG: caspase family protein [Cyclobacteriaceae bacterium]|nr:caspase family protein [Cyclobacteriaceae bacterium]
MKKTIITLGLILLCYFSWCQAPEYKLETVIQRGHRAAILSIAYSPDGKFIATGSRDNSIKLWEVATGREIRTFLGHLSTVNALSFDPTGLYLASGSSDKNIIIWEVTTGKEKLKISGHKDRVTSVAFSPDGTQLASAGWDRNAYIWSLSSGEKTGEFRVYPAMGSGVGSNVLFSKDAKHLITGNDDGKIIIYNLELNIPVDTLRNISPSSCGGCPSYIQLNDKGTELLSASRKGAVTLWSLKSGKIIKEFGGEDSDYNSVGTRGNYVFVSKSDTVKIWNIAGKLVRKITVDDTEINAAKISPNGKYITVVANDRMTRTWNIQTGKLTQTLKGILNNVEDDGLGLDPESYWQYNISRYINFRDNISVSPDEKSIVKGHYGNVAQLWNLSKGRVIRTFDGHEKAVICSTFSKDGKYLFTGSGDKTAKMWEVATGKEIKTFKGHRELIFEIAISENGKYMVTGSWDSSAILWDIESGEIIHHYRMDNNSPYSLSFALNDNYLLVGGIGRDFKMIEIDTGEQVRKIIGHSEIISDVKVKGSNFLTASWDGVAKLWDMKSGLITQKFVGHQGHVYAVTFDKNKKWVATASADRTARLWDIKTGKELKSFQGHSDVVTSVDFINNDQYLITHSLDGTTKIWDISTGKELITHILIGFGDWLVKTESGFFDATEKAKENIFFVKGLNSYSLDQFFDDFYRPGILSESFQKGGLLNQNININNKLDNSPPPTIEVISPKIGETFTHQEIDVMVKITNQGGGIDEVKLLHNGKRLTGDDRAIKSNPKKGKSVYQSFPVHLIPGKNILSISAFSQERIESSVAQRELFMDGVHENITCHVMTIGINKYKNPVLNLNYAYEDAESFLKMVKQRGKKLFNKTEVYSLFNEEATKENILSTLDEIALNAKPHDVFLFYYAGHGSMVDGDFYFIPTDNIRLYDIELLKNDAVYAGILQKKFANISALKQMVVIDACQSGGSTELLAVRGASEEKALAQLSRSSGVHVLAASGSEQFATEFKELGHGLFTYVLLEAMSGKADGAPKDGKVTIYELKSYIDDQVPEYSEKYKGKPQYPVTYSRGQDFPVVIE